MGEARRSRILELLRAREAATVEELAELLAVSKMTVHRDLDRLADLKLDPAHSRRCDAAAERCLRKRCRLSRASASCRKAGIGAAGL